MPDIQFDTYYRYTALTDFLEGWAESFPELCQLTSLGQSYEGREIWLMTVTNFETGPAEEKPAYWIDGNIHATELAPSATALYLLQTLLDKYGTDERITYLLDSRVFYVVPRLNPDGAEWALADQPKFIRSSTRPYPRTDKLDGLHQEDIDGDGRILQMRIRDPHGGWKSHPEEPRLLIRREPDDLPGQEYYRLLTEGSVQNYDGVILKDAPALQGLDLNRNYPVDWHPSQKGGGPYPTSEPEVRHAVQFIVDHPNITGAITFHTFSGVHLRPLGSGPDDQLPTQDLRVYKRLGQKAEELTGYPAVSLYHDFKYDPKDYIKGTFDTWMYEHLGVYAWTTEIWSIQNQAGLGLKEDFIEWFKEHSAEDDLQIFRWAEEHLGPEAYVDWQPYDHPQLGQVELGGWDVMYTWRNPPHHLLEKEIAPLAEFAIYSCLISPKLEVYQLEVESQGDIHSIQLVLHNTGWLPTYISEMGKKLEAVRALEVDIELPEGARLLSGELKSELGQLAGRDHISALSIWTRDETKERVKVEWVVQAPAGSEIELVAVHQRAGTVREKVTLG